MKSPRLLIATICLIYLTAFTLAVSAEEREDEYESREVHTTLSTRPHTKLEELREKIRNTKKSKKIHRTFPQTPSTSTGKTSTGTATKPTPTPVTTKPVTSTPVTRSATVNYGTPEGSVPVTFSVTVRDGVITSASSTTQAGGPSGYYQDAFKSSLATAVVGKKVSTLSLSAIGGASLTTNAFAKYVKSSF